jgi:hypothetical protein
MRDGRRAYQRDALRFESGVRVFVLCTGWKKQEYMQRMVFCVSTLRARPHVKWPTGDHIPRPYAHGREFNGSADLQTSAWNQQHLWPVLVLHLDGT